MRRRGVPDDDSDSEADPEDEEYGAEPDTELSLEEKGDLFDVRASGEIDGRDYLPDPDYVQRCVIYCICVECRLAY